MKKKNVGWLERVTELPQNLKGKLSGVGLGCCCSQKVGGRWNTGIFGPALKPISIFPGAIFVGPVIQFWFVLSERKPPPQETLCVMGTLTAERSQNTVQTIGFARPIRILLDCFFNLGLGSLNWKQSNKSSTHLWPQDWLQVYKKKSMEKSPPPSLTFEVHTSQEGTV